MFGFLKDKLKKAIGAFSKSAESEVKEEKITDEKTIEKAKQEEKVIAKKIEKKEEKKPEKKETPKEEKRNEKKEEKKEKPKIVEKEKAHEKPAQKIPEPVKIEKKEPEKQKTHTPEPKQEVHKKDVPKVHEKIHEVHDKKEEKVELKKSETKVDEEKEIKQTPKPEEKKGFFSKLFGKKEETIEEKKLDKKEEKRLEELEAIKKKEERIEERLEEIEHEHVEDKAIEQHAKEEADEAIAEAEDVEDEEQENEEESKEKSGFFGKLKEAFTKKTLTEEKFDELFWELELAMLENNVAVEVIEKIKNDLKEELTSGKVSRMGIEDMITTRLRQSVEELFDVPTFDLLERIKNADKPYKICMIGVNGAGKTTTLAKLVHLLKKNDLSVVLAASDTFRAAAIDQLQEHANRLGVKMISQGYNADPAAVAFDAIKHAESKNIDVVIIDTAGRLHSNTNLMQELEKVVRVAKPDMKIFIGESITGNDCVEQATVFNKLVGIDAIILSKADIDEKGGAAISVSYVTGKPILYLGMGQTYDDLVPFDKEKIIESLEL